MRLCWGKSPNPANPFTCDKSPFGAVLSAFTHRGSH
jgi:hypothetical protein